MRTAWRRAMMAGHPARVSAPRKDACSALAVPPVGEVARVPRREGSCRGHLPEAQRFQQPARGRVPRGGAGPDLVDPELLQEPAHRDARVPLPTADLAEDVGDLRPSLLVVNRRLDPPEVRSTGEPDGVVDPLLAVATRTGGAPRVEGTHLGLGRTVVPEDVLPDACIPEHREELRRVVRTERLEDQGRFLGTGV